MELPRRRQPPHCPIEDMDEPMQFVGVNAPQSNRSLDLCECIPAASRTSRSGQAGACHTGSFQQPASKMPEEQRESTAEAEHRLNKHEEPFLPVCGTRHYPGEPLTVLGTTAGTQWIQQ